MAIFANQTLQTYRLFLTFAEILYSKLQVCLLITPKIENGNH